MHTGAIWSTVQGFATDLQTPRVDAHRIERYTNAITGVSFSYTHCVCFATR